MKFCSDYVPDSKPGFTTKICCLSCHEDADEFGYALTSAPDDEDSEICCGVANWLKERKAAGK